MRLNCLDQGQDQQRKEYQTRQRKDYFPPTSDEEDKIELQASNLDGLAGIYRNVLQQCQCKRKLCKIVILK